LKFKFGPVRLVIFPYEFHFRCINTHTYIPNVLSGNIDEDKQMIIKALGQGKSFVGYDLPASTKGFRFTAKGIKNTAWMGEEISVQGGITIQIRLPKPAECRLIHNGNVINTWNNKEIITYTTTEPGAYRVEAYIQYLGKKRGWIFSNPIYVTK
jgi:hypothetical protein